MAYAGGDELGAQHRVVEQVAERFAHAGADLDQGGEVEYRVPWPVGQHGVDRDLVGQLGHHQRHAIGHRRAMPGRKVVEHDDVLAARGQQRNEVAADIAGAAGDQEPSCHLCLLPEVAAVARMVDLGIG